MEAEDFDVIPVMSRDSIDCYFERQSCGPPLRKAVVVANVVSADLALLELIQHFAESGRYFYLTLGGRRIDGIVTRADLNKLAVRVLIYAILNRLELLLSEVVNAYCEDSQWLPLLDEVSRKKVEDRIHQARSQNVELPPTAYLDLSDLLQLCKKTPKTWEKLGVQSAKEMKSRYGPLVDLRNDIAHPVRSLVSASKDATRLWKRIDTALRAVANLE